MKEYWIKIKKKSKEIWALCKKNKITTILVAISVIMVFTLIITIAAI